MEANIRLNFHQNSVDIRKGLCMLWLRHAVFRLPKLNYVFADFARNPHIYNNIHIRNYENGHLNEILKRQYEIHVINKEMAEIEKRVTENVKKWKKKWSEIQNLLSQNNNNESNDLFINCISLNVLMFNFQIKSTLAKLSYFQCFSFLRIVK